ncbi:TPA: type II toxin-antitoxin system RelE/ParE family toxin [Klebsiella pneumoniae]|uniref:type II toxin-antitoxin system RelE/ParE family toxin n=1 Tax=Morganella morganii TaxID=582 RepID=UPI000C79CC49|nr:type II toxin-antitoxin system RelE/ParE family toxin [Morganella morganii]HBZ7952292.1 type II toxin-antitoxin system RelE/ParE family toxin [Klebsiella pneumoniae]HDS6401984.1 type II toxin-antitoxin system RelE/ParE family toxin [Morganella morganii subsp. morganii]ELJ5776501.1 type II toxin-antitoxin system RelE/ParE family toxin [Morganella morganii]EMB6212329.1 type II toxin-antitoxin system RelE/ParE family toxin [Morganella morganii]MBC6657937.1 type II toxin-antitoxin system RelE/P
MWKIVTTDNFTAWFAEQDDGDRAAILAAMLVLEKRGPGLPKPYADTVKGSRYTNMKELRIQSRGQPIRAFFAFAPERRGVLLCAGYKTGKEKRFYMQMIPQADREYTEWLNRPENRS